MPDPFARAFRRTMFTVSLRLWRYLVMDTGSSMMMAWITLAQEFP